MIGNPGRAHPARVVIAPLLLLSVVGCAAAAPPVASEPNEPESTTSVSATPIQSEGGGGTAVMDPGTLDAGTRYVIESLGVSIQPDVDGWFAVLPQGGDAGITLGDVSIYFLRPSTVLAPDSGSQIAAPADPQAFIDAIDATGIVDVDTSEPFEAGGLHGISAEITASGGSDANPLLTTGSGEYGLFDGEFEWVVVEVDGAPLVLSIERSDPDIDAAWEVAQPVVESLEAAP